jgi:hypothetical protein
LFYTAVFHQSVFVYQDRFERITPIDFEHALFVRQSNDNLILQVVTISSYLRKAEISVSSCHLYALRLKNIQPEESTIIVQQKDIIQIQFNVHNSQSVYVQKCAIDDSKRLDLCRIFHWNGKDLHVCIVAVSIIDSITEIASQEISEPTSRGMGKFQEFSTSNLRKADIHVVIYDLFDGVAGQINEVKHIFVGIED